MRAALGLAFGLCLPQGTVADPLGLMTYDHIPAAYAADMRPLAFAVSYAPVSESIAFVFDARVSEGHLCTITPGPSLALVTQYLMDVERQNFGFAPVEAIMAMVEYRADLIPAYAARSIPPRGLAEVERRYEAVLRSVPPDEGLSLDQVTALYDHLASDAFAEEVAVALEGNVPPLWRCPFGVVLE